MEVVIEKKKRFDLKTLPKCIYTDGDKKCTKYAGNNSAFCHWHTPKVNYFPVEPEKLSVPQSIRIVNQLLNDIERPSDIPLKDQEALPLVLNIIKLGKDIAFKEESLVDAQQKLNNAIKKIAEILQREIKSAPLFERIINEIIAIDLNETKESVKKKIKAVSVAAPAPVVEAPAIVDPVDSSINTNSQSI